MKNNSFTYRDSYKEYIKTNGKNIDYSTYKNILYEFSNVILNNLLYKSECITMPYGFGYLCIVKYKPKTLDKNRLSIDYKSSKEFGKIIYHLNEHSDGYKYRLFWSKIPKTFPERYKYQLQLVRKNKRLLAKLIFNNQDYININDIQIYKM